jgi:hypothetical protein
MEGDGVGVGRRSFVKAGLWAAGGVLVTSGVTANAAEDKSKQINITWEADVLPGGLDDFKALAKRWEAISSKDPNTLYSKWLIAEDRSKVRLAALFTDAQSAQDQFPKNLWHELDVLIADNKIDATSMVIGGELGEPLEFLREFNAEFMVPVVED